MKKLKKKMCWKWLRIYSEAFYVVQRRLGKTAEQWYQVFFCQARSAPSIYQTVLLRNLINFLYDLTNVLIEILEHINQCYKNRIKNANSRWSFIYLFEEE